MMPPGYSTYVIYSCINMSYAPRQSRAQSQTSQSCSRPAAAVSAFTRRRLPYGAGQRPLAAPGLSLSATSSASEAAASGERYQSRFHREAFSPIGEASSDSCPGGRLVLERVREPGVSGATNAETRAWLSGVPSAANFSSNIYLIVCYRISWNRLISCWSPTMPARLVVRALLCLRRICMTQGDHFRFWMLIQLLNSTLFNSADEMVRERHRLNAVVFRRTKADSCRSDGSPLFARRWVHTESFVMSKDEQRFYEKLREYLEDGFALAKRQGSKGRALGFVMTI